MGWVFGLMPDKAVSKKQFRFFKAVAAGDVKQKGLTPAKAEEMLGGQSPAGLPERAPVRSAQRRSRRGPGRKQRWRVK